MKDLIVVFASQEARRRMLRLLRREGYNPVCCSSGAEALRAARRLGGAAVVSGFRLPDMTAEKLAEDLQGTAAVLAVSSAANLALCGGKNLYKLPIPATPDDFRAALDRLTRPAGDRPPPRSAEEQALIQKAKEALMERSGVMEPEAHRLLQKRAMDAGITLSLAAEQVLAPSQDGK